MDEQIKIYGIEILETVEKIILFVWTLTELRFYHLEEAYVEKKCNFSIKLMNAKVFENFHLMRHCVNK